MQIGIYLPKGYNGNTTTNFDICSKFQIKKQNEVNDGAIIVQFEQASYNVLVFLLSTLNRQIQAGKHFENILGLLKVPL